MNFKHSLILIFSMIFMSFGLPKNIQKKVDKQIKLAFNLEVFELVSLIIPHETASDLPAAFGKDNLFEIRSNDTHLGYAYVAKAPSKTDAFDYLVLFDADLIIVKSKVLIYREDYGGEIGSKRWLKQFIGKSEDDTLEHGKDIAAISGATISTQSMTHAVNNLLKSMKILHQKDIL